MSKNPILSDSSDDCPCPLQEIEEYLDLEDFDRRKDSMKFVTKAKFPDRTYWIWEYLDSLDEEMYMIVTQLDQENSYILTCGTPTREVNRTQDLAVNLLENNI